MLDGFPGDGESSVCNDQDNEQESKRGGDCASWRGHCATDLSNRVIPESALELENGLLLSWRTKNSTNTSLHLRMRFLASFTIFLLFLNESGACTVPVFRYALDQWRGESDPSVTNAAVLVDVADRILSGDSAVWIQVDSGDEAADKASFERLVARLKFFESVAELPEIDPNDPSSKLGPGPALALRFSTLRIKRSNPVVTMLVGPEKDSPPADEPWIAPVFGRGRVLGIWPASLMDEEGIDEACFYLTGACSCQVKLQNPGWDLVMNIDWEERLYLAGEGSSPEDVTTAVDEEKEPEQKPDQVKFTPLFRPPTADINLTLWIAVGLLMGGFALVMKSRKSKSG